MAKLDPCINCGNEGQHLHHVVPKSLGGNEGSNLVSLCLACHGLVHGKDFLKSRELQKAGIERAKKEGKYKGRKKSVNRLQICYLYSQGLSQYKIADKMKISRMSVHRCLNEEGLKHVKVKIKGGPLEQTR